MQHCVVVEFITDEIADIYRKRPTKVWITATLGIRPEMGIRKFFPFLNQICLFNFIVSTIHIIRR